MAKNLPTSYIEVPADPNVEGAGSGANGGSCAPGIGICTAVVNPKLMDWSVLDQHANARSPQATQHIGWGGDSVVTGQETADLPPVLAVDYAGATFDSTMSFVVADTAAADGLSIDTVTSTLNRTGANVEIGDRVWGTIAAA